MCGISRIKRLQCGQSPHGEAIAVGVRLPAFPHQGSGRLSIHANGALVPGADHGLKANTDTGFGQPSAQGHGHLQTRVVNPGASVAERLFV